MCGKSGFLFEEINSKNINNNEDIKINSDNFEKENNSLKENEIIEWFDELNNRCCGEVNEQYEIEQLERDFLELFQKIKRFNTKRVYKTTKDLYKLFKRK